MNLLLRIIIRIKHRNRLKWIFVTIPETTFQEICCKTIISKMCLFTVADQTNILGRHTVKFDIYSPSIVLFRIQYHFLNSNCQIEINYLERSIKNVSFKVANKLLSHDEIDYLCFFILFVSNTFILFELN